MSAYLRILNDDDRHEGEEHPIGMILCKDADKAYVEYVMQDYRQPMGVVTYKTAEEMDPNLLKVLPPKEEIVKLLEGDSPNKTETDYFIAVAPQRVAVFSFQHNFPRISSLNLCRSAKEENFS